MKLNLRGKTILIIASTSLAALLVTGVIINWRVNISFENFLESQFQFLGNRQGTLQNIFPDIPEAPEGMPFGMHILRDVRQDKLFTSLESDFREQVWKGIFLAGLISAGVAIAVGWFFANRTTRPLEKLKKHIIRLRKHDYERSLAPDISDDEIGDVARSFDQLRIELQRVEELRKDAISDMAHEITTPLQSLLGSIEGIEEGIYQGREQANVMKQDVDRIRSLVDDMRLFSHSRAKIKDMNQQKVDLLSLLQIQLQSLKKAAEQKGLEFQINIPKKTTLLADPDMLAQILTNLVKNAIDYTDKGSVSINVETKHQNKDLFVTKILITDSGIGIDPKHLPYIFERFYRVDKSRNRDTGSTGLGLAIVKEYVEQLGWEITISSEVGKGSTFTLKTQTNRQRLINE